ncbi:hypothetical protein H9X96_21920 [Pedobacter sp. N36a]|uniref:hypothetical protein n=1 Tax=Pedobacter sp. N36a TaxID=2767996 RepID=UPI001656F4A8|nr:hypothetical protein [Pedobacter sp. N36a]MBC8988417.1 hypothetical protein [Pedobacter sp. N36a]
MKFVLKNPILIRVFLLLVLPISLKAQSTKIPYEKYAGKVITTTAAFKTTPLVIVQGGGSAPEAMQSSDFVKKDKQTWSTSFSQRNNELSLLRELKRIEVTAPGPSGPMKYDSDNTFESTDGAERLVNNKLKILKKKVSYHSKSSEWETNDALKEDIENIWEDNFPTLGKEGIVQGLFFSSILPKNTTPGTTWEETIVRPEAEITNTYTIEGKEGNHLTLKLVSKQVFLNKNKLNTFTLKPIQGKPIQPLPQKMGSTTNAKKYEGKIVLDPATMFILKMDLAVTTETNMINGNTSTPRTRNATLSVTNSF